jgi:hypothetical protein
MSSPPKATSGLSETPRLALEAARSSQMRQIHVAQPQHVPATLRNFMLATFERRRDPPCAVCRRRAHLVAFDSPAEAFIEFGKRFQSQLLNVFRKGHPGPEALRVPARSGMSQRIDFN